MKISHILLSLLFLTGLGFAEPTLPVTDVSTDTYAVWLTEKNEIWADELTQLNAFSPEKVQELQSLRETIAANAAELGKEPEAASELKKETHQLVFALESKLEQLYVRLDQASGPALVYDF